MAKDYVSNSEEERRETAAFENLERHLASLDSVHASFLQALLEVTQLLNERIETEIAGGEDLYESLVDLQRVLLELQSRLDRRADDALEKS